MIDLQALRKSIRLDGGVSRRVFLAYMAALSAIPRSANQSVAANHAVRFESNPFTLGVASGDPDSTSVVLWTKLAPKPLEANGGMKPEIVPVQWEVFEDDALKKVAVAGQTVATPQLGHSVHVVASHLKPDRWYWFRFRVGDKVSPIGRTRTFPTADATPNKLKFAFASCQHYEQGYYSAYRQMAKDDLDLVIHLGDYIYEYPHKPNAKLVRQHTGPKDTKILTLQDYRGRHALYRSDELLQNMHAQCPWLVTWDDHEFDNNYANDISEKNVDPKKAIDPALFLIQRAAAYQAYYEFMPLRPSSMPNGPDMMLYRQASFGRLAEFFVLDTRQYRTDQPNGDGLRPLNEDALKATNTLLGKQQRGWLDASLLKSQATWNVLAQQVMMAMVELKFGDRGGYSMDQWPGAAYERIALLKMIADRKIPNPVVLTGDIHSNWANELRVDDREKTAPVVAAEFVGTSISSGGNGPKEIKGLDKMLADNPSVKFHNRERGYVRCEVTDQLWKADYMVVDDVLVPESEVKLRKSYVLEAGSPLLKDA